ncbi:hypothetical protein HMI54_001495 [Coelomomyces lativittatus]|nr:hypothetical protein HMI55_000524 [Coelomomyces lativittatus]KAJ1510537.1 hypothetical protein HMI54_001495 [Coelomomyces lativittatus]
MHESIFASVSSKLPRVGSSKVSKSTSFLKPSKRSVLSKRILSFQPKGSVFDASFKSTKQ